MAAVPSIQLQRKPSPGTVPIFGRTNTGQLYELSLQQKQVERIQAIHKVAMEHLQRCPEYTDVLNNGGRVALRFLPGAKGGDFWCVEDKDGKKVASGLLKHLLKPAEHTELVKLKYTLGTLHVTLDSSPALPTLGWFRRPKGMTLPKYRDSSGMYISEVGMTAADRAKIHSPKDVSPNAVRIFVADGVRKQLKEKLVESKANLSRHQKEMLKELEQLEERCADYALSMAIALSRTELTGKERFEVLKKDAKVKGSVQDDYLHDIVALSLKDPYERQIYVERHNRPVKDPSSLARFLVDAAADQEAYAQIADALPAVQLQIEKLVKEALKGSL